MKRVVKPSNMLDAVDRQQLDHYHDLSVGEIMRRARIAQNLGITGIADTLNIRVDHLSAIENNNISALPPRVYALGFVRSYAEFLGLDGEKLVYLFKSQMVGRRAQGRLSPGILKAPELVLDFRFAGIAAVVIVTLASAMIWGWQSSSDDPMLLALQDQTVPDVPAEMLTATDEEPPVVAAADTLISADVLDALSPAAGSNTYGVAPDNAGFAIIATDVAWVEVKTIPEGDEDTQSVLLTRVLAEGDIFYAPKDQLLEVNTGNALGLQIVANGNYLDFPKAQDVVVRGLKLKNGYTVTQ